MSNTEQLQTPQSIRVWQMNDCECFAAATEDEALKAMAEMYDFDGPEGIAAMRQEYGVEEDFPRALDDATLETRKVNIGDPDDDTREEVTFRVYLDQLIAAGDTPCFFSTTEF